LELETLRSAGNAALRRGTYEQIELQAKLLNYFLGSDKSNINQSVTVNLPFSEALHDSSVNMRAALVATTSGCTKLHIAR